MAKSEKRDKLLDACRDLLNELPARELTLDLVAERSGINRGLIFYYFESREGLLLAVTEKFREMFFASFEGMTVANTREWLNDDITRLIDLVARNAGLMGAVTFEFGAVPGVVDVLETINEFNSERVAIALGLSAQSDFFRAVVGSWGIYCARLALQVMRSSHVSYEHLIWLMIANLQSSLDLIRREEPELGVPLNPFP